MAKIVMEMFCGLFGFKFLVAFIFGCGNYEDRELG